MNTTLLSIYIRNKDIINKGFTIANGVDDFEHMPYKAFFEKARNIALHLLKNNYDKQKLIVVLTDNELESLIQMWGAILAGIPVSLLPDITSSDFVSKDRFKKICKKHNPIVLYSNISTSKIIADLDISVQEHRYLNFMNPCDFMALPEISEDDIAIVQFTSGTTRDAKGITLTHKNIMRYLCEQEKRAKLHNESVVAGWLPYSHDMGLFGMHFAAQFSGVQEYKYSTASFMRNPYNFLKILSQEKITYSGFTNTALKILLRLLKKKKFENMLFLENIIVGAEKNNLKAMREFSYILNIPLQNIMPAYGLAESVLGVSVYDDKRSLFKSVDALSLNLYSKVKTTDAENDNGIDLVTGGTVFDIIDCVIVNDNNMEKLPPYYLGHICIRGESVFNKYYDGTTPDTVRVCGEEYIKTGDIGFLCEENSLYPVSREKEMIIANGINFYLQDLDVMLENKFPALIKSAVCMNSEYLENGNDEITVLVVPIKSSQKTNEKLGEIGNFLQSIISTPIKQVIFGSSAIIKRTTSGKIMRDKTLAEVCSMQDNIQDNDTMKNKNMILKGIWANCLETDEPILESDNFFNLGGSSIKVAQLCMELEKAYNTKFDAHFVYHYPTFLEQIKFISSKENNNISNDLEVLLVDIIANTFNIDKAYIKGDSSIMKSANDIEDILNLKTELCNVFLDENIVNEALKKKSIVDMAKVLEQLSPKKGELIEMLPFQETLYFHKKNIIKDEITGMSCYIVFAMTFKGKILNSDVNKYMTGLFNNNESLRYTIEEKGIRPFLKANDYVDEFLCEHYDISDKNKIEQEQLIQEYEQEFHNIRLSYQQSPMAKVKILYLGSDRGTHIIGHFDHMIVDGYSLNKISFELMQMMQGKIIDTPMSNKPFSWYSWIFNCRRRACFYNDYMKLHLKEFTGLKSRTEIPVKQSFSNLKNINFKTYHSVLSEKYLSSIKNIVKNNDSISLNSVLFACLFKVVNMWNGQKDIVINMPILGRELYTGSAYDVKSSFIDILPIYISTDTQESVLSMAIRIEEKIQNLLKYPISSIDLSRRIAKENNLSGALSPIIFSNSIDLVRKYDFENNKDIMESEFPRIKTGAPGTWIDFVLYNFSDDKMMLDLNYVDGLFDAEYIEILAQQYESILCNFIDCNENNTTHENFNSLSSYPKKHLAILQKSNDTYLDVDKKSLQEIFSVVAGKCKDNVAITFNSKVITYAEMDAKTSKGASIINALASKNDIFVAVCLPRCDALVLSQFSILKAGLAFLPIDISYPKDRVEYMLRDSQTKIAFIRMQVYEQSPEIIPENVEYLIDIEQEKIYDLKKEEFIDFEELSSDNFTFKQSHYEDIAYMIYTSGSTGNPKGVMVSHYNFYNFSTSILETFSNRENEQLALVTSPSFDMTLASNIGTFFTGATLHILSEEDTLNIATLFNFLEDKKITFLNITPSHFNILSNAIAYMDDKPKLYSKMNISLGGEVINIADVNNWYNNYPEHTVINEYGPTEASVASSFFPITEENNARKGNICTLESIPIGKPMRNTQYYIVNEQNQLCMIGVPGRLLIGGDGVSKGYWQKEEKTREVFVDDYEIMNQKVRVYDTNDVARWLSDGSVQFLGRNDRQINLRGYRIEPGEIESILLEKEDIVSVFVMKQEAKSGSEHLACFYKVKNNIDVNELELVSTLEKRIPDYMIPEYFKCIEDFPLTPSGKMDVSKMPNIVSSYIKLGTEYVEAKTKVQEDICRIWQEVLGIEKVGIIDNFWDIGGDSIRAMNALEKINQSGYKVNLSTIFNNPTIEAISESLDSTIAMRDDSYFIRLNYKGQKKRLICFPYAGGSAVMFMQLANKLENDVFLEVFDYAHFYKHNTDKDINTIAEMAYKNISSFEGETLVLGYCFGGYVAHQFIQVCTNNDTHIDKVIITGSTPPSAQKLSYTRAIVEKRKNKETHEYLQGIYAPILLEMSEEQRKAYWTMYLDAVYAMCDYNFIKNKLPCEAIIVVGAEEEYEHIIEYSDSWEDYFSDYKFILTMGGHMCIYTELDAFVHNISQHIK